MLLLLAAVTRFYGLGDASFWADEVFTLKYASLPWSELWVSAHGPTPPLYYSIIKLMMAVSVCEWWLRLPSALFGTLTAPLLYLIVRTLFDARAALASGLLLVVSIANLEYSQEGRAYALAGMCIAVSFLGLVNLSSRWQKNEPGFTLPAFLRSGGALYGLGVLAALYSHNTTVFYWIAAQFFFLAWWLFTFRSSPSVLLNWFLVNLVVLILWAPWLLASLQLIDEGRWDWLGQYPIARAAEIWRRVNSIETGYSLDSFIDVPIIALTIWGLWCLRRNTVMAITLLAMVACSSLVIWAYGFVAEPVFMRRSIVWGSMFSYLLIGVGISRLPLVVGRLVLVGLLCVGLVGVFNYHRYSWAENDDWRSPAGVFNEHGGEDDVFLFRTVWQAPAFLHYVGHDQGDRRVLGWSCRTRNPLFGQVQIYPGEQFSRVSWSEDNPGWDDSDLTRATIWVIDNQCHDRASIESSDGWLSQHWVQVSSYGFKGVTLHQWEPRQVQGPIATGR